MKFDPSASKNRPKEPLLPPTPTPREIQRLLGKLTEGIRRQEREDEEMLHLTAYDNRVSRTVASFLSVGLSQRYNLGSLESHGETDPASMGEFVFKGLPDVYAFERMARRATAEMFHACASDFRPLSGIHGMMCTMATFTEPGDAIYSVECDYGGHFATRHVATRFGRRSAYIPIDPANLSIDLGEFARAVKLLPPKAVYFDVGCALFPLPIAEVRDIVRPETIVVYDASHTQGLIAGGAFQSPLEEGADLLQGNTHKTFPGPQKGMIHFRHRHHADRMSEALTAGLVSSQHTHHSLALYATILEMWAFARPYTEQTLKNAQALGKALLARGFELLERKGEFTRTNVLLLKSLRPGWHVEACRRLYACGIATNSRHAFGHEVVRIGVQEVSRQGMREPEMEEIALFLRRALIDKEISENLATEIKAFNRRFLDVHFSFDRPPPE